MTAREWADLIRRRFAILDANRVQLKELYGDERGAAYGIPSTGIPEGNVIPNMEKDLRNLVGAVLDETGVITK